MTTDYSALVVPADLEGQLALFGADRQPAHTARAAAVQLSLFGTLEEGPDGI